MTAVVTIRFSEALIGFLVPALAALPLALLNVEKGWTKSTMRWRVLPKKTLSLVSALEDLARFRFGGGIESSRAEDQEVFALERFYAVFDLAQGVFVRLEYRHRGRSSLTIPNLDY